MKLIAAIIIPILLMLIPPQQSAAACVVSGTDVAASLAEAQAGARCLDIPAGTYAVGTPTAGAWLNATADNLEIRGAGMGKTILRITSPLTLTSDLAALRLFGVGQRVHDLTIDLGTGHTGTANLAGISVYGSGALGSFTGRAERTLIERVEVQGGYSFNGSGGYGIGTYRLSTDNNAAQFVTIRDCSIHDSLATGIGINSNQNTIIGNHIARVGTNGLSHGIYAQGGYNLYDGNVIENASGYSFHGYKQVPGLDGSGDRYIGNLSINPGSGHIVINGTGTAPGTRYATIQGNAFRNTLGHRSAYAVWCNGVPCLIDGNTLEDTYTTTGAGWIEDTSGSIITSNLLTTLTTPDGAVNFSLIRATGISSTIANNRLTMSLGCCYALTLTGVGHVVTGNQITLSGQAPAAFGNGILIGGDGMQVQNNRIVSSGVMGIMAFNGAPTNLTLSNNYFKRPIALGPMWNVTLTGVSGQIHDNIYDGSMVWSGSAPGVLR